MVEAPERIRVAQDAEGFWTCREAISGSQEYLRSDIAERQIAELRAERDKARARVVAAWNAFAGDVADDYAETTDVALVAGGDLDEQIRSLTEQRDAAEAENARLRAIPLKDEVERVMEPFAEVADDFDADGRDLADGDGIYANKARDFRAARSLLSRLRAGEQEGWRSMDSAPGDEETPVLLWIGGQHAVGLTWRRRDGSVIGKAAMFGNATAEKWQPLPAAPSHQGGDRD